MLSPKARDVVLDCCLYEHGRRAHVYAAVVMPDHVHIVMSAARIEGVPISLSEIMHTIKSVSAHRINKFLGRRGPLWQEESFDHAIRSDESLNAKMAYVLANPVRRGLVRTPREYRWVWSADPEFMEKFIGD
jgi:REP element-mobilizing transposase RayT